MKYSTSACSANAATAYSTVAAMLLLSAFSVVAEPTLDFTETHYVFGDIAESGKTVSHVFRFANNGDSPLVIYGTESGCGCTAAEFSPTPVAPGDSGFVNVTYTAEGNPGRFVKGVRVKSNIPLGETLLTIEGRVIRDDTLAAAGYLHDINGLRLTAVNILSGNIEHGERVHHKIRAINGSDRTVSVYFPDTLDGGVHAEAKPDVIMPGEKTEIVFCFDTSGLWGEERVSFPVCVNNGNTSVTDSVSCMVNVFEPFDSLTPDERADAPKITVGTRSLNLGEMIRGVDAVAEIEIKNMGKSLLNIRKIESSSPCLSATIQEKRIECGKSGLVSVVVSPDKLDAGQRLFNERIRVITDDPENPVTQIQITASFR